ncbi:MAG: MFS transporter [Chloroflexia bacterium]|nr:MFS transporter [Chloroflexia bacterium]
MTSEPGISRQGGAGTVELPGAAAIDRGRLLLLAVAAGITLAPLNSTMIAVALPEIQGAFGISITASSWLVTLYLVAMAAGQPVGGRLGDLYGRRRVYLAGLIGFGLASLGCALAPGLEWLIAFRMLQGRAGALSLPNGTAMIREAIPEDRRGAAFGTIGMAAGIAAGLGPPLGGILVHSFGWGAIFWANVPVIAMALMLGWRSLPRPRRASPARAGFDMPGTALLTIALTLVILIPTALKVGGAMFAIGAGLLGLATGWGFVRWELKASAPVIDLRLFAPRHFAAACAAVALGNLVMYTTLLALPLFLEGVLRRGVQVSGYTLVVLSALSALFGPIGGRWSDRAGRWLPAVAGGAAILLGAIVVALGVGWERIPVIVGGLAIMGVGLGTSGAAIQTAAMESVPLARAGSAAGIFSTSRYLGSIVGSTILAASFARRAGESDGGRYLVLFTGLAVVAIGAIIANALVADRQIRPVEVTSAT